jgi:hypothetical protein
MFEAAAALPAYENDTAPYDVAGYGSSQPEDTLEALFGDAVILASQIMNSDYWAANDQGPDLRVRSRPLLYKGTASLDVPRCVVQPRAYGQRWVRT